MTTGPIDPIDELLLIAAIRAAVAGDEALAWWLLAIMAGEDVTPKEPSQAA